MGRTALHRPRFGGRLGSRSRSDVRRLLERGNHPQRRCKQVGMGRHVSATPGVFRDAVPNTPEPTWKRNTTISPEETQSYDIEREQSRQARPTAEPPGVDVPGATQEPADPALHDEGDDVGVQHLKKILSIPLFKSRACRSAPAPKHSLIT